MFFLPRKFVKQIHMLLDKQRDGIVSDSSDKPFSSDVTHKRPNERKTTQVERIIRLTETK